MYTMQATLPSRSHIHAEGGSVVSLHTMHYAIGPFRVDLTDATSYDLARLLSPSFAPFEEKEAAEGEPLLQLRIDHQQDSLDGELEALRVARDAAEGDVAAENKGVAENKGAAEAPSQEGDGVKRLAFDWDQASCVVTFLAPGEHFITITPKPSTITYGLKSRDFFTSAHLGIPEGLSREEVHFVVNNYLMMLYAFAAAPCGVLLLHASAVVHQGKAYLFLGKSGTGKSTHSRLWLRHIPGCHLLNDDNPLVEVDKKTQRVTAYGSPWSGKTPCYRRESYPLGGVARLEQAPANVWRPAPTTVSGFGDVLPSCSMLRPEQKVAAGVMGSVFQLVQCVPVIEVRCLPDAGAALMSAGAFGLDVTEYMERVGLQQHDGEDLR